MKRVAADNCGRTQWTTFWAGPFSPRASLWHASCCETVVESTSITIEMKAVSSLLYAALCAAAMLVLTACDRPIDPASGAPADPGTAVQAAAKPAPPADAPTKQRPAQPVVPDRPPSDREITASAANAMRGDPALAGADLSVMTSHGVVSLTGTVRSPEQVAAAEARAQSPSGVMRVETHLAVDPER